MLNHIEEKLRVQGEQLLFIETSDLSSFIKTQQFYRKYGYIEEGKLGNFIE